MFNLNNIDASVKDFQTKRANLIRQHDLNNVNQVQLVKMIENEDKIN
jgi:hypothetical protein